MVRLGGQTESLSAISVHLSHPLWMIGISIYLQLPLLVTTLSTRQFQTVHSS